jgi:ankyrin repeat protein
MTIVKMLLKKGAHVNAKTKTGDTALMKVAMKNGGTEIARILLNNGADVNLKNDEGWTALMLASEKGHIEIVNLLRHHGAR